MHFYLLLLFQLSLFLPGNCHISSILLPNIKSNAKPISLVRNLGNPAREEKIIDQYHFTPLKNGENSPISLSGPSRNHTKPFDHRIVNGQPARLGQLPHQLSLRLWQKHLCGASFAICPGNGAHIAVTAAHCVTHPDTVDLQPTNAITVHAGILGIQDEGQMLQAQRLIKHPNYQVDSHFKFPFNNDIAVVILDGSFNVNDHVKPISLPSASKRVSERLTVSGWGKRDPEDYERSPDLRVIQLPKANFEMCQKNYQDVFGKPVVFPSYFCLGGDGKGDSCEGDSGGPATANNQLQGVTSWGYSCNEDGYPGIFVSVPKYVNWIKSVCMD